MPRLELEEEKVRRIAHCLHTHCLDLQRLRKNGNILPAGDLRRKDVRRSLAWVSDIAEELSRTSWLHADRFFTRSACELAIRLMVKTHKLEQDVELGRETFKTWVKEQAKHLQRLCMRARRNHRDREREIANPRKSTRSNVMNGSSSSLDSRHYIALKLHL